MHPEAAIGFSPPLETYDYLPSSVVVVVRRRPSWLDKTLPFGVLGFWDKTLPQNTDRQTLALCLNLRAPGRYGRLWRGLVAEG
jgi:hypothetical protein